MCWPEVSDGAVGGAAVLDGLLAPRGLGDSS